MSDESMYTSSHRTRRYQLPALDRTGIMLGLSMPEMLSVGVGAMLTLFLLSANAPALIAMTPLAVAFGSTKVRWRGLPLAEAVPPLMHWLRMPRSRVWLTDTPWTGTDGDTPAVLKDLTVTGVRISEGETMAVIFDRSARTATAVLRVPGTDFSLLHESEQEHMLDGWGLALASHALEGSPLLRIGWTESARRASLDEHVAYVQGQGRDVDSGARREYLRMVHHAAPETVTHDVYLTLVVSAQRLRRSRWASGGKTVSERLTDELRRSISLTRRGLKAAGLETTFILDRAQLGEVLAEATDPGRARSHAPRVGGLAHQIGLTKSDTIGPRELGFETEWFTTDRSVHRSYWVEDWPRHAVNGPWLTELLSDADQSRRFTVWFDPVPPASSHRRIQRELAKLDADTITAEERGRRVTASARRTTMSVQDREEELVSGYAEAAHVGVVTLSAPDLAGLEASTEHFEAQAIQAGLVLRPTDHQHDLGWAASLPLGLGAGKKGFME